MALMPDVRRLAKFQHQGPFVSKILRICTLCVGILFNLTALGIHLCKTSQLSVYFENETWR